MGSWSSPLYLPGAQKTIITLFFWGVGETLCKCACFGETVKYLHKDDHIPDSLHQYDVRATLAQLLVVWETDLEQSGRVLQLLHVGFYRCHRSVGLRGQRPFRVLSAKTGLTFSVSSAGQTQ